MGMRREYATTQWFTKRQVSELRDFNLEIRRMLLDQSDVSDLTDALTTFTSILSVVTFGTGISAPAGIAALIFAAISALSTMERDDIVHTLDLGEADLSQIKEEMEDNNYTAVNMYTLWLEFVDEGFKTVQGAQAQSYSSI